MENHHPIRPPFWQFNGHLQTILPAFRHITVPYQRSRIATPDADFIDIDGLYRLGNERLIILTHGLEGDSSRPYISGAARFFFERNWDVMAWMCRSCSGQLNEQPKLYSHGQSEDLACVVNYADSLGRYSEINLIGYSMGGSLTLKYLGQSSPQPSNDRSEVAAASLAGARPTSVRKGIAFSAPCKIVHSVDALERPSNYLYKQKFYRSLSAKIRAKVQQHPEQLGPLLRGWEELPDPNEKGSIRWKMPLWRQFDAQFSAPLNGFETAEAFYEYASAANFMAPIDVPVLLVNALNDPIIPPACTPWELAAGNPLIHLEAPALGGHVGFHLRHEKRHSWMELRALAFLNQ